ncbi:MAG TPA: S9 family peptidase [Vicinamibacterales bacterium]|nr:S9 family peptidase [Vicinamibacterales bacterium]
MRYLLVLLAFVASVPASAQTRTITETDLFRFVWVADPQVSPDGSRVAFVRVSVDEKADAYDTSVWLVPADGSAAPRRLTSGNRDTGPRWSPDGRALAFARGGQIHLLPLDGGEARAITEMPRGAGVVVWSPDGTSIAFTSIAQPADFPPADGKPATPPARQSDVRVIREPIYRSNGVADFGFVEQDRPSHIWVTAVPAAGAPIAKPKQLTSGEFGAGNLQWSTDGARILFVSDRRPRDTHAGSDTDLYAVTKDGGDPVRIASIDGTVGPYTQSADGRRIAFAGTKELPAPRSYDQPDLWVVDLAGGEPPRNLTAAYDFDITGGLAGDQRAPRGGGSAAPIWTPDGRSILVRVGERGDANLKRIDARTGAVTPLTSGHQEVMWYTADASGATIAGVISTQTVIGDLHAIDAATGASKKLTGFNDVLFEELTLSEPEEVWYDSFDGQKIQGWILKPPSVEASKRYPLILQIHGGPHAAYGNTFTHEFQWMAAKGYVVFFTNPRGSSNYGQDFGNVIQYRYPGDDAKDILTGVDWLLKKGYVDEARMGVTGGSGGGLLTNWIVTQTPRFKAAVSQRDISDWASFWYTADFSLFTPFWFRKAPFEDPQEFAARSPLTYAARITTPMMFILGDEDWRTPPSAGGEPLFRALKYQRREAVMVRFPDENHDLSRSGKPWHRVERLQHIVGWMDKYLR